MKSISVYDTDADRIDKICEEKYVSPAELIQTLLDMLDDDDIDLDEWL